MINNDLIVVKQLPVIEEQLHKLKADITERVSAAVALDCNEDTVKEIKKVRAELNKEFAEYEDARKGVKKAISEPYDRFNEVYKECVSDVFKAADGELKAKIAIVENSLKKVKHEEVTSFAVELRTALGLDWLDVNRVIPNITLSGSKSSLVQKVSEEMERINEDVNAIEDPEVFAEYKKTLSLAQAQTIVKNRRAEIERAKAEAERKAAEEEVKQEVTERVEMIAPPTVEEPTEIEETFTMTFTVTGTIEQLKMIKAFMIDNNIDYIGG
jgi:hypothetical protein